MHRPAAGASTARQERALASVPSTPRLAFEPKPSEPKPSKPKPSRPPRPLPRIAASAHAPAPMTRSPANALLLGLLLLSSACATLASGPRRTEAAGRHVYLSPL